MQVELLISEPQRDSPLAERLPTHPECLVEPDRRVDVGNRQNEMVERADGHTPKYCYGVIVTLRDAVVT
jgi:hypothetical protein